MPNRNLAVFTAWLRCGCCRDLALRADTRQRSKSGQRSSRAGYRETGKDGAPRNCVGE